MSLVFMMWSAQIPRHDGPGKRRLAPQLSPSSGCFCKRSFGEQAGHGGGVRLRSRETPVFNIFVTSFTFGDATGSQLMMIWWSSLANVSGPFCFMIRWRSSQMEIRWWKLENNHYFMNIISRSTHVVYQTTCLGSMVRESTSARCAPR